MWAESGTPRSHTRRSGYSFRVRAFSLTLKNKTGLLQLCDVELLKSRTPASSSSHLLPSKESRSAAQIPSGAARSRVAPHSKPGRALCPLALTQRARPVTRGEGQQRQRNNVRAAPRLPLRLRAPRLLRRPAGLRPGAAAGLRAAAAARRRAPDADRQCGTRAAAATVGRPDAGKARAGDETRTALLLDAGRGAESEGARRGARDVAMGDRRRETRHEAIRGGGGTKVARAPRSVAG